MQTSIAKAEELAKWKQKNNLNKNSERIQQAKSVRDTKKKEDRKQVREIMKKHKKQTEKIKDHVLSKIEINNVKRETNILKKNDQQLNFENIKRQHQENMLRLQVKHFGVDVKNKIKKASLDMSHQKNMILENAKKLELSVNEAQNSTYQIRPTKHLREVG